MNTASPSLDSIRQSILTTLTTLNIYSLSLLITAVALAALYSTSTGKDLALFAYNCFLKPFGPSTIKAGDQQSALESFYKGQASIYDSTRKTLLKGRDTVLSLTVSHAAKSRDLVWIDYGGGTGWNIEKMNEFMPISNFKAVYLVDLSPSLCEVAKKRFVAKNWKNVHVVCIGAHDFDLPKNIAAKADIVTMSYSLSMIPAYYSLIDKISTMLSSDGIFAVVDFYVQNKATLTGATTTVGGEISRHVNWLSRTFWRLWFEFDRVYLDSSRRDYLEYKFGTVKSINMRNKTLGHIPYYIWLGCDKDYSSELTNRIDALATESPYLSPVNPTDIKEKQAAAAKSELILRSKGYEVAVINMERNLPYPSFFYQNEHWRIFYDFEKAQYNQFGDQYIYAFTWEDPREDIKILDFKPTDTVMAITSAGDNILSYAAMDKPPRRFHCVDLNPHQGHLLELKLAALKSLSYDDFWKIFGEGKHADFETLLVSKMSKYMSSHAFQFWIAEGKKTFDPSGYGLYDTGSTRWALRLARWLFKVCGVSEDVKRLCKAKTMEEQKAIWIKKIKPAMFNPIVCKLLVGNPVFLWKALGVPVNQTSMIEGGILKYVVDTIEPLISRDMISTENYFYYLCLMGCYSKTNCPDYLTKKGHFNLAKRKNALEGIRIHTDTIKDVVERLTPKTVNVAIVMDHMDWFSPGDTAARDEIRVLNRALCVGGRVMLRSSSKNPWYIKTYEKEGFKCHAAAVRESNTSIDRVNMYASTWVCTKQYDSFTPKATPVSSSLHIDKIEI